MARKSIAGLSEGDMKKSRRDYSRLAQKSPMTKEWNTPLKYCIHVVSFALSHLCISNNTSEIWYIKCTVNSVNRLIAEGVAIGHTEISHFWGMKICVSGALARFARSRVLVNKWVKAFCSIEYNQSSINNGIATGLTAVHTNIRRLHWNILFLTLRRSLASLARAYWYNIYIVTGFAQLAHYYTV